MKNFSEINFEELLDRLPHGSGIDSEWNIIKQTSQQVVFLNAFHLMDENGYYNGWVEFKVKLFTHKKDITNPLSGPSEGKIQVLSRKGDIDYKITFGNATARQRWQIKDYLNELFHFFFFDAGIIVSRNEIINS